MKNPIIEKFKLDKVSDIPLMLRQGMHEEITGLLLEIDEYLKKEGTPCGRVVSEKWPITYMFDKDTIIIALHILGADMKEIEKVMVFNFPRDEIDKLLEEVIK